jgi:tetratricopeptide (TPR) repeat protein
MRDVAERTGKASVRLRAMEALRSLHTMRAEYATTRSLGEETIALARQIENHAAAGAAGVDLASALIHLGDLEKAHEIADRGRASLPEGSMHAIYNGTLLVSTCAYLGHLARSRAITEETIARARALGDRYLLSHTTAYSATIAQVLRDVDRTRALATEALRLTSECGFTALATLAAMNLGWCDVHDGRLEEGRSAVRAAFLQYEASGQRISTTSYAVLLIEAHLACGDVASADESLARAFAFVAETGERMVEPELHRLRGACAQARGETERAAEHFEQAIAVAAAQKSALLELRAATSLFRLRGKSARGRVARLVERFRGGDECADARDARALLAT